MARRRGRHVGRAQVWSMDIIVAVIIFLLAVSIFYVFTQQQSTADQARLRVESELVARRLTSDQGVTVVDGSALDEGRLDELIEQSKEDYSKLKTELGLRDDFCILLVDQGGNILLLGNSSEQYVGFGNSNLSFNLSGGLWRCGDSYS